MSISRSLRVPISAMTFLVSVLLAGSALGQQAHIRGTVSGVKDGTITVQNAKGGTEEIKLASDVGFFLVTKSDLSAVQTGKFVGITSVEQGGKRVAARFTCSWNRCAASLRVTIPGILNRSRT